MNDDLISRQAVINLIRRCNSALEEPRIFESHHSGNLFERYITELSPANPQEPKIDVIDEIRAEIEQKARPNEIGGRGSGKSIRYGLCMALEIIDKYKAESEEAKT